MGAFCKFSVLALLAAGLVSNALAEPIDAVALVRTLRKGAAIEASGGNSPSRGDIVKAAGLNIDIPQGSFASLAFPNNMALIFTGSSKAKILKFELLDKPQKRLNQESCPSIFEMNMESGTMFMSRAEPKSKSKFLVKTKLGDFEAVGENMRISLENGEVLIYAHNAAVNYYPAGGGDSQYIGMGYFAKIKSVDGKIKLTREKLEADKSVEDMDFFSAAQDAWKSTYFDYSKQGEPVAKRVLSPAFWARPEKVLPKN